MTSSLNLAGQRMLVVGGARGIGLAIAQAVGAAGGVPIVGARDGARATEAAAEIAGAESVQIDVTDETSIAAALATSGAIDHVIVTASAHHNVAVTDLDHDGFVAALEAKVIGPMLLAKHAAAVLPPTGSILLFSGVAAWKPSPGYTVMGITNGAVAFAATHLARELAPIRVNAISPGIIDSGVYDGLDEHMKQGLFAAAAAGSLAGRTGTNADIVDAALWLLTAGFVTGETVHVEGGARFA